MIEFPSWLIWTVVILAVAALITGIVLIIVFSVAPPSNSTTSSSNSSTSGAAQAILAVDNTTNDVGKVKNVKLKLKAKPQYVKGDKVLNATNLGNTTPTLLEIKFISAYLAEDVDPDTQNNIGQTEMFYLNPECNEDIGNCGVGSEYANNIQTYFDFSQTTAQVNAQLNSQARPIAAGTYKYVRLEFCKTLSGNEDSHNIQFTAGDMTEPYSYARSNCAVTAEIVPPLTVSDGDSVTVSLAYDITDLTAIWDENPGMDECSDTSPSFCTPFPTFVPSATL
jgi:hypothetical protein